ncbi:RNA-directed DNA polymerase from mobile element jockey [Frankliniella fusca]|uniref:RNA-directed DNA polymerase from mobile element jockey n=1 Tax=Frankliniella fusca TaxID=407009 RepID=A0AAE1HX51_9NEOP|nr:RNA-directed DNA polymerase from mobile element jockey [Frankliniella fusca]
MAVHEEIDNIIPPTFINLDHNILIIRRQIELEHSQAKYQKEVSHKVNYKELKQYLKTYKADHKGDAEEEYNRFLAFMQDSQKKASTPTTKKRKEEEKYYAPWIDSEYLQLVKRKEKLYLLKKKNKENSHIEQDYKTCRNALTSLKRKKKEEYYSKKITESDNIAKNIWKVAKEVLHNQETQNESYKGEKTPDEFNNQFINTVNGLLDKEKRKVKPKAVPSKIKPQQASFRLYKTTTEEISKYIDELKNKTNQTLDKLTSKLIKICKEELAPIIMDLVNISFEQEELIVQMKQDMHVLMEWMELNNLFINIDKTQYIIFKKLATVTSNIAHFVFKNQKIQRTDAAKFLGLLIDENLLWDKHINSICKKIAPIIGVTFRLKNLLDQKSKKSIYYGLIQSRLTYMASIWGSATSFRLKPLKILQKRAIKSLFPSQKLIIVSTSM